MIDVAVENRPPIVRRLDQTGELAPSTGVKLEHRLAALGMGAIASVVVAACSGSGNDGSAPAPVASTDEAGVALDPAPDAAGSADAAPPFAPADHRPWPQLVLPAGDGGAGHVLSPMTLVTIVAANDDLSSQLFAFSDALITSAWWHSVGDEYGMAAPEKSVHVTGAAIDHSLSAQEIATYIDQARAGADAGAPAPNGNTLYLLYIPAPYEATGAASSAYHAAYPYGVTGLGDGLAVVSRATPEGDESILDELTERASHEIIEAATDTSRGWHLPRASATPWSDADASIWRSMQPGTVENGDLCELSRIREPLAAGFLFQRSWSNKAALRGGDPCVPARTEPYFNVSVAKDWYSIAPGQSIDIPFSGWSTAETDAWLINAGANYGRGALADLALNAGLTLHTSLGIGTTGKCGSRQGVNNGVQGTLHVTAPAAAKSGDYAVLWIHNFREEPATCNPAPESDFTHVWPVGVYVE